MKKIFFVLLLIPGLSFSQSIPTAEKRRDWGWQSHGNEMNFFGFNSERAVADNFTLGLSLMLNGRYDNDAEYIEINAIPSLKGTYYFKEHLGIENEKIDLFGGLGVTKPLMYNSLIDFDSDLPVGVFFHTGARYFISENFGFKADVSLGRAGFQNFVLGLYISRKKNKK